MFEVHNGVKAKIQTSSQRILRFSEKPVPLPQNSNKMNTWIIYSLMGAGLLLMVAAMILLSRLIRMKDAELRNGSKMELKVQALKIIMPFEHNLAQQLYVSNSTWNAVVNAKEELVNQINTTFEQLKDEEDVSILAQSLVALPNPMVEQAVAVLKRDFERLL